MKNHFIVIMETADGSYRYSLVIEAEDMNEAVNSSLPHVRGGQSKDKPIAVAYFYPQSKYGTTFVEVQQRHTWVSLRDKAWRGDATK